MRFYQTMTILPDALISVVFLRRLIWQQLHLILAENKTGRNNSPVAVAFPDYCHGQQTAGNRLRLLARDYQSLAVPAITVRLSAFYPYIRLSGILPVPETLPFIWTESLSGKGRHRPFPFFIRKLDAESVAEGPFTCYGLSHKRTENGVIATVPHF
ncbi:type I-F CRISPR-associated endoribonuclease Cas6/Csy4 [Morganella morganii]|uniref:Type I-F CRISPR-associated endoribonuclease Cas6/Csy4 n=1 Tax=Morganella morganii TaxID=582 RepID=A0A433ZZ10_MORMO|nr:type I-F CRISPR-associated endoribonuclease Cas6/Csy4 [Morganella morganii]RUT67346.1 type I-F CRISPR-associated endoribonuclease Cas6/Csy4 [Morganella morganii]